MYDEQGYGYDEYTPDGDKIDRSKIVIEKLKNRLHQYEIKEQHDELIRDNYPPVKDAWEHYQTMLGLAKDHDA